MQIVVLLLVSCLGIRSTLDFGSGSLAFQSTPADSSPFHEEEFPDPLSSFEIESAEAEAIGKFVCCHHLHDDITHADKVLIDWSMDLFLTAAHRDSSPRPLRL